MRHGAAWSDACILNISSRGMMIHTGRPIARGTQVEIWRGDQVILASVVRRDGARAGLRADAPVPIDEIITLGQSPGLRLTANEGERRKHSRSEAQNRVRGRAMEFAGVLFVGISLGGAGLTMVETAFARPLALVSAALGG